MKSVECAQRRPWTDGTLETSAAMQGPKGQALRRETLRQKDRGDFFPFFLEYRMISVFL